MSDPVTNVEIEDVLSSIRRLVSEDARGSHPDHAPEPAEVKPPEALVLTQEHRVAAVPDDGGDSGDSGDGNDEPQVSETARSIVKSSTRLELERAIAELEAAVGLEEAEESEVADTDELNTNDVNVADAFVPASFGAPEDAATQAVSDASDDDLDWEAPIGRAVDGAPPQADGADDIGDDPELTPETVMVSEAVKALETAFDQPTPVSEPEPDDVDAAFFSAEAEVSEQSSQELDTESADQDPAGFFSFASSRPQDADDALIEEEAPQIPPYDQAQEDSVSQPEAEETAAEANSDAQAPAQDAATVTPFLRQRPAPAQTSQTTHTDEQDDVAFVPDDLDDTGDVENTDAADDPSPMSGDPFDDSDYLDDDGVDPFSEQVIDEAMLRDMVAEIVRQELQGELGERITRNVRKLVRREINRALAGQDFI